MTFPNQITGTFNRNIVLRTGFLKVYKNGSLFLTFTESDIVIVNNIFTINVTNLFPNNGNYYVNFTTGLFESDLGEVYAGVSNNTDWAFSIVDGEYTNTDYSNEYLIN